MKRLTSWWTRLVEWSSPELRVLKLILESQAKTAQELNRLTYIIRQLRADVMDVYALLDDKKSGNGGTPSSHEFDLIQLRWKLEDLEKKLSEAGVP